MRLPIYLIDAFTDTVFGGNPAAVVPLTTWLSDEQMQKIAQENNQAETAFFVANPDNTIHIRWFTPLVEVNLCGHATLAAAHVLFNTNAITGNEIIFNSRSGKLVAIKNQHGLQLDFPLDYFLESEAPDKLIKGLRTEPKEIYIGREDYLCVFDYEEKIKRITPDFAILGELKSRGVIVTAKGNDVDYVCRFFAPAFGINEDQATGSIQTTLTNYWSKKLNKKSLTGIQLSQRVGKFFTELQGDRVLISGQTKTYLTGEIEI